MENLPLDGVMQSPGRPDEDECVLLTGRVDETVDTWTVLADPEGNEFCVLSPRDR